MTSTPTIAGLGIALPPTVTQDEIWDGFFATHYRGDRRALARRIFTNSGVSTRHAAVSPLLEDVADWSTERRMRRYQLEAVPLGKEAVSRALTDAGVAADELGLFVVCSCTGYATPGLDILLARDLGMSPSVQRLFVGHMGCYAALPGIGAAADFVAARGRPALLLCAELTSLHLQPAAARADLQQIVSHALFSDAAAAVVITPSFPYAPSAPGSAPAPAPSSPALDLSSPAAAAGAPSSPTRARASDGLGYVVREVAAVTDTATADHMTWEVTDQGFRMGLSPRVPAVLSQHVRGFVDDLLSRHDLTPADIDAWAVHPGGPKILDVVQAELGLPDSALAASHAVLAKHGNCSSPTVLLALAELRERTPRPRHIVMLAFGPGLTLYATLLTTP